MCFDTKSRRLKAGTCPLLFSWLKTNPERSLPEKKKQIEELNAILESELTDTASEGEGKFVSRATQVNVEIPCDHRFSVRVLLDLGDTKAREENYFNHLTGFNSYTKFQGVLKLVLPAGERKNIVSYTGIRKLAKTKVVIPPCYLIQMKNLHKAMAVIEAQTLALKDEFLLVLMKLRLRLTNLNLAITFRGSEATVPNIFITWLNFLYIRLGALKVWPHRRVIFDNMPKKFKEEHSINIIIIDCTELKIQCPSSLVLQSAQSYSNYKSTL